jgi:pantoate--beta-alanine ligase
MATIIHDIDEMQRRADSIRSSGQRIGLVPTMGALHDGHLSLVRIARERADAVITTVFVNPRQFGQGEDFDRYPRDLVRDLRLASSAGTDLLFAPEPAAMYPAAYRTFVHVEELTDVLEGAMRPGHFRGVTTVVSKLFMITKPHMAVFGQKDAQQAAVIRRMVRDLNFDITIVVAPTVREKDGLAMSSRNVYLTAEQRREAPAVHRSLLLAEEALRGGERNASAIRKRMGELIVRDSSGIPDYISVADAESLREVDFCSPGQSLLVSLAVRFGTTRLIDNTTITL